MGQGVSSIHAGFKAHGSFWQAILTSDFIIDWLIFKQLVNSHAVALQVFGQLLADIIHCLVGKATDHNAGSFLGKMLGSGRQWQHVACLLETRDEFLRNCSLASACCTNQAEALSLKAKLNSCKLLSIEFHAACLCMSSCV